MANSEKGKAVDWERFGLNSDERKTNQATSSASDVSRNTSTTVGNPNVKELFEEEQTDNKTEQPWWKANFFIREPVLFGTWDGVFTSCVLNIFGVVIFLRTGWMVDPSSNIPAGTLAALGFSGMLYIIFAVLLGAVCTRAALIADYMIASK
ncbi:Solute carrier family 12 member 8, partial [Exaiptasia diaphana]